MWYLVTYFSKRLNTCSIYKQENKRVCGLESLPWDKWEKFGRLKIKIQKTFFSTEI